MAGNYRRSSGEDSGTDELARFKRWYRADIEKTNKWRKEAREDFQFRDGYQWSEEDKRTLEEQGRPVTQFNRLGSLVDAVVGAESANRREVRYIPREQGDSIANEILTSAAEWFRDQCDAEDEESEAFKDTVTAGMGWTETRMDRSTNPDGDPKIERVDPFEMVWDCDADKANLVDSRRRWRVRKMTIEEAKRLIPEADEDCLNAAWADEDTDNTEHRNDPLHRYEQEAERDNPGRLVTIVACQFLEEETYYKVAMIIPPAAEPQVLELDEAKFKMAMKAGMIINAARLKRETVKQAFLGSKLLKPIQPTPTGMFSWSCITGLKDNDQGTFYGVIRRGKDPQRWLNKWLAQTIHIFNSQAKGGIIAERGVFENEREAEESWARTDRITWAENGALSGVGGPKIQPKPMAQFPASLDRLIAYADEMIVKATGISMELLGIREVNQPGILEYQRKQAGMGILASFFDSLRRYRKIQGRVMLKFIRQLADGRLVRIVGEERAEYVPLTQEAVAGLEYDIIVDDAPSSPNEKERTWQIMQSMLPMLKDVIGPEELLTIAEYSPLPASFVEKMKKLMAEKMAQAQQQGPDPAMQMQMQAEAAKNEAIMAKAQADVLKSNNDVAIAQISADAEKTKASAEVEKAKAAIDKSFYEANARENEANARLQEKQAGGEPQMGQIVQVLAGLSDKIDAISKRGGGSKRVVRGPDGRATHLESDAGEIFNIMRGPDGRLAGFEAVN